MKMLIALGRIVVFLLATGYCNYSFAQFRIEQLTITIDSVKVTKKTEIRGRYEIIYKTDTQIKSLKFTFTPKSTLYSSSQILLTSMNSLYFDFYDSVAINLNVDSTQNSISSLSYYSESNHHGIYTLISFEFAHLIVRKDSNYFTSEIPREKLIPSELKYQVHFVEYPVFEETTIDTIAASSGKLIIKGQLPLEVSRPGSITKQNYIFPNPSQGTIVFDNKNALSELKIFTINGFCLESHILSQGINTIRTSLPNGTYIIRVGSAVEKLIIQR